MNKRIGNVMHLSSTEGCTRPAIFQRLTGLTMKEFEKRRALFSAYRPFVDSG